MPKIPNKLVEFKDRPSTDTLIKYIAAAIIGMVGMAEMLRVAGFEPSFAFDVLKSLLLIGIGLFIAFVKYPRKPDSDEQ